MPLEYVLHARYMGQPFPEGKGSQTWGNDSGFQAGSPCRSRLEAPFTGNTIDVNSNPNTAIAGIWFLSNTIRLKT